MKNPFVRLALVLILVSIACTMPGYQEATPSATPRAVSQLLVAADPNSTYTPTPFQPVAPTITSTPTATPTRTPKPTRKPSDSGPSHVDVPGDMPGGTTNIMVLGSDFRSGQGYRTDILLLVSVNGDKGSVSVVSFPRDLYVTIPGWGTQRINTAFSHGFSTLADTLQYNFGVRPDYYIMTNFDGFIGIVNSKGGIKVNVGSYLSDSCDLPQQRGGRCTVNPGNTMMDGDFALWYVRSRHTTSDLERGRRAQEVLYGLFRKMMSIDGISRLPELYDAYRSSVETNMSAGDMAPLLPVAANIYNNPDLIRRYTIGRGYVYDYITPEGAMVLLPNYDAIKQLLAEAIYN